MSTPTAFRDLDRSDAAQPSELALIISLFDAIHRLMSYRRFGGQGPDRYLSSEQYIARLASKAITVIQKLVSFLAIRFLSCLLFSCRRT